MRLSEGPNDRSPNTYTHGMMRDIDEAIVRARFDDSVTCIVLTGNGASFFSAGASIQMLNSVSPGFKYNFCLHANETLSPRADRQACRVRHQRPRRRRWT